MSSLVVLLALHGCRKEEERPPAPGELVDLSSPVAVDVTGTIGMAPNPSTARAVNEVGAAVPSSSPMRVTVGGVDTDITFDSTGYGAITMAAPGTAEVVGALRPAKVHALGVDWPGFGMFSAQQPAIEAQSMAAATRGWLVAGMNDVWWVAPGQTPHRVVEFSDGSIVGGVRTAHIDTDGVLDAAVWGGNTVVLLKGRSSGGMAYGAAVRLEGAVAAGAAADDATGDGVPDVTIAWVDQSGNDHLQVLMGDGLWAFENQPANWLERAPDGIAIGDNVASGSPQITVTYEDGSYQRFVYSDEAFLETGPELTNGFPLAATFESGVDMNGDGGHELLFFGPLSPDQDRSIIVYDMLEQPITFLQLNPPEGQVALGDSDTDGLTDLFMLFGDQELIALTYHDGGWLQNKVASLTGWGPMAANDIDGDRVPELLLGDYAAWTWWNGVGVTQTDGSIWWGPNEPQMTSWDLDFAGPVAFADIDGNPNNVEFVSFQQDASSASLVGWRVAGGTSPTVSEVLNVTLASAATSGVDLAVCDDIAWALTETEVHRVDLGSGSRTGSRATAATRVDCGSGPSGSVAALLSGDTVELLNASVAVVGTESHPGAKDVTLVQLDSGNEVAVCTLDDCTAQRWEFADDGRHAFAYTDSSGIHTLLADGTPSDLGPWGHLSGTDVDGDGHPDLVSLQEGTGTTITVWRATGQGWGPAESWHTTTPLTGTVFAGDVTADGQPDLFAVGFDGNLYCTTGL